MKKIAIISTFPNNEKNIAMLKQCVQSIDKNIYDIMVVSHHPLRNYDELEIQYFIYDYNNKFLPHTISSFYFDRINNFDIKIYIGGHELPICRNISNGVNLAKSLGYRTFLYTESDVVFEANDFNKLNSLLDNMWKKNKKMLFFKPKDFFECYSHVYETVIFGGDIDYFLSTLKLPINYEQWIDVPMGYTFELAFFERFSHDENRFEIVNEHSCNYFKSSQINLSRRGHIICEMLYENDMKRFFIFIKNRRTDNETIKVNISNSSYDSLSVSKQSWTLVKSQYWINDYLPSQRKINIEVMDLSNEIILQKEFNLNENIDLVIKKGSIKYTP